MSTDVDWNARASLKSRIRNVLMSLGGERALLAWWKFRGHPNKHVQGALADRFTHIYESAHWTGGAKEGILSGPGSTLTATEAIRQELPRTLVELSAQSLLDVGCGDYTWMRAIELPCSYVGVDIVKSVIDANQREFGDDVHRFAVLDACAESLPKADVVLCREVMFHLSFSDLKKLMRNIERTGARYLIATTDVYASINVNIPSGDHSPRNLTLSPFTLGPPERTLIDDGQVESRYLGVWRLTAD